MNFANSRPNYAFEKSCFLTKVLTPYAESGFGSVGTRPDRGHTVGAGLPLASLAHVQIVAILSVLDYLKR